MGTSIAGLEGIIAGESEICYIDGYQGVLSYRGFNIHTLADNASFEEVIFLLWNGWLPKQAELDRLKKDLVAERELPAGVIDFLNCASQGNPMDRPADGRFHARCLRCRGAGYVPGGKPSQSRAANGTHADIVKRV